MKQSSGQTKCCSNTEESQTACKPNTLLQVACFTVAIMDAPQVLKRTRQQLIKKLLERKKDIESQLEQLGFKEKAGS
jgi:hypothetical protein